MHAEGMLSARTLQPRMRRWYRAGIRLLPFLYAKVLRRTQLVVPASTGHALGLAPYGLTDPRQAFLTSGRSHYPGRLVKQLIMLFRSQHVCICVWFSHIRTHMRRKSLPG
jgi:hypothetical protein